MADATIRVGKMEVARRQIDAAIRMTFSGEDPIAIHSVAAAARQIVKDASNGRDDAESYRRVKDLIVPGHEREFWTAINKSANFFKHADQDLHALHEMDEYETDFVILFAVRWYHDLGFTPTPEMRTFFVWFGACHPRFLTASVRSALAVADLEGQADALSDAMQRFSRRDQLAAGQLMLTRERSRC